VGLTRVQTILKFIFATVALRRFLEILIYLNNGEGLQEYWNNVGLYEYWNNVGPYEYWNNVGLYEYWSNVGQYEY
jgi:hypothetical protein